MIEHWWSRAFGIFAFLIDFYINKIVICSKGRSVVTSVSFEIIGYLKKLIRKKTALKIVRKRVVSPEAQTPTSETKITGP